jgi:hypothetical protein
VDGVDDDACPETSTILSNTPSFLLEASFGRRSFKRSPRQVRGSVLLGVEAREMLTNNLCWLVALDYAARPDPACDVPFRGQHVDRVVRDALHEDAELLFAPL